MGIEIDSFRVYKDRQFFDFMTSDGEIANLVVIYAPNGFGKTSFFDAIEWSLTGEINRIKDNPKIKNIVESEQGVILKNKFTDKELGRVKIISETNDVIEVHTKKIGEYNRKTDYKPGSIVEQSDFFKNIDFKQFLSTNVLGQDKIDSFLRFASPRERYNTLKNFWDHNNETSLYLDLLNILQTGKKQEASIVERLKGIVKEIKTLVVSSDILNSIKKVIANFNKGLDEKIKLEAVSEQCNEEHLNDFVNLIIEKKTYFELQRQNSVNYVDICNNINNNFQDYENNLIELQTIDQELKKNNLILDKEKEIKGNNQEIENNINSGINLYKEYKKLKYIYKNTDFFINSKQTINKLTEKVYDLNKKLLDFVKANNEVERNLNTNQQNIKEKISYEGENENSIKLLENSLIKYNQYNWSRKRLNYFDEKSSIFISKREGCINELKNKFNFYNNILLLERELLIENNYKSDPRINEMLSEYKGIFDKINSDTKSLNQKKKEYTEFGEFNSQLNQIINIGRKLVDETQTKSCPLCKQEYSNYKELLRNVDEQVQDIFGLEKILKEINNYESIIENSNKKLEEVLQDFRVEIRKMIRKISYDIQLIEAKNNLNLDFINKKRLETQKLKEEFEKSKTLIYSTGISINGNESFFNVTKHYIDLLNEKISETRNEQLKLTNENTILEKEQKKLVEDIRNIEMEIEEVNLSKKELLLNPLYQNVINLLNTLNIDSDYNKVQINNKLNEMKDNLKKDNIIKRNIKRKNAKLMVELKDIDINSIRSQAEQLTSKRNIVSSSISNFILDWTKNIKESPIQREVLQNIKRTTLEKIDVVESKISDLLKLQEYTNILENNLVRAKKLKEKAQLVKQLSTIEKANEKLGIAINLGKSYIVDRINEVFNLYSINNIYQRIEPHPDLKIIKFEPDFTGEKPEINIYASSKEEDVAPVIYFSAAQLNILSLSIFIARALENEDKDNLNTIFMDDPVQHLDSINILSFIDLLRSITTKENKQVILSTHNDQLFKLIRKKMDPNFTSSKFIELESFGKIRV